MFMEEGKNAERSVGHGAEFQRSQWEDLGGREGRNMGLGLEQETRAMAGRGSERLCVAGMAVGCGQRCEGSGLLSLALPD